MDAKDEVLQRYPQAVCVHPDNPQDHIARYRIVDKESRRIIGYSGTVDGWARISGPTKYKTPEQGEQDAWEYALRVMA